MNGGQLYVATLDDNREVVDVSLFDRSRFVIDIEVGPDGLLYGANLSTGEILQWV